MAAAGIRFEPEHGVFRRSTSIAAALSPLNRHLASRTRELNLSIVESGDGYQSNFHPTFYPTTRDPVPSDCFRYEWSELGKHPILSG